MVHLGRMSKLCGGPLKHPSCGIPVVVMIHDFFLLFFPTARIPIEDAQTQAKGNGVLLDTLPGNC